MAATVGVGQLRRGGDDEGAGELAQVVDASRLVLVQHRVACGVHGDVVLDEDRRHQPEPVVEVVLERGRVALARRRVDLAQRDAADPTLGEQHLGRGDEALLGGFGVRRHQYRITPRVPPPQSIDSPFRTNDNGEARKAASGARSSASIIRAIELLRGISSSICAARAAASGSSTDLGGADGPRRAPGGCS